MNPLNFKNTGPWLSGWLVGVALTGFDLRGQENPSPVPVAPGAGGIKLPAPRAARARPAAGEEAVPRPAAGVQPVTIADGIGQFSVVYAEPPPPPPMPALKDTRFSLEFGGGRPRDLIDRIQEVTGEPVNAIIPKANENVSLPPLKMRDVTVGDLFATLMAASRHTVLVTNGASSTPFGGQVQQFNVEFGFIRQKSDNRGLDPGVDIVPGRPIWYFVYTGPQSTASARPPVSCRYFNLEPYLTKYQVEDITTAVQTGWSMLPERHSPDLKYHGETMLLIAVGTTAELALIESVLRELSPGLASGASLPVSPVPTKTNSLPVRR